MDRNQIEGRFGVECEYGCCTQLPYIQTAPDTTDDEGERERRREANQTETTTQTKTIENEKESGCWCAVLCCALVLVWKGREGRCFGRVDNYDDDNIIMLSSSSTTTTIVDEAHFTTAHN